MHALSFQTLRALFLVFLTAKVAESAFLSAKQQVPSSKSTVKSGHHAVFLSDLKTDDAIAIVMAVKVHDSVDVIVSGIKNKMAGILAVQGAIEKMLKPDPTNAKIKYIISDDGADAAGHELTFPEVPPDHSFEITTFGDYLASFRGAEKPGGQKPVVITQIAPFPAHLVDGLINSYWSRLNAYLLIAMFNAGQGSEEEKFEFLTNLQKKLNEKQSGKVVPFLYSNNWVSVSDREIGSTIPIKDLIGILPSDLLESAAKDPFHSKQLSKAAKEIDLIRNPPDPTKLKPGEKPTRVAQIDPSSLKQPLVAMSEAIKTLDTWTNAPNLQVSVKKPPPAWFLRLVVSNAATQGDPADPSSYAIVKIADALKKLENAEQKQPLAAGHALQSIVHSARAQASAEGKTFRLELKNFVQGAIDNKLSIAPRLTSVLQGLSNEFPIEACDGIHYASWNRVILPFLQRDPVLPFQELVQNPPKALVHGYFEINSKNWVVAKKLEKTSAENDAQGTDKNAPAADEKIQADKKSEALILWESDLLDPRDSPFNARGLKATLFEDLSKMVVPQTEPFSVDNIDPFRPEAVASAIAGTSHPNAFVLGVHGESTDVNYVKSNIEKGVEEQTGREKHRFHPLEGAGGLDSAETNLDDVSKVSKIIK